MLTAFIVGLGLDTPLTSPPTAPHLPPKATPSEWTWLHKFTTAIQLSECFKKRMTLPVKLRPHIEDSDNPDERLGPDEKYQPIVCEICMI